MLNVYDDRRGRPNPDDDSVPHGTVLIKPQRSEGEEEEVRRKEEKNTLFGGRGGVVVGSMISIQINPK